MLQSKRTKRPLNPLIGILIGLIGIGAGIIMFTGTISSYQQAYVDSEAQCIILSKSIITSQTTDPQGITSTTYDSSFSLTVRPQNGQRSFIAQSNGQVINTFSTDENAVESFLNRYAVGKSYPCWYNPNAYSSVILDRSLNGPATFQSILMFFIFTFAGSICFVVYLRKLIKGSSP